MSITWANRVEETGLAGSSHLIDDDTAQYFGCSHSSRPSQGHRRGGACHGSPLMVAGMPCLCGGFKNSESERGPPQRSMGGEPHAEDGIFSQALLSGENLYPFRSCLPSSGSEGEGSQMFSQYFGP